MIDADNFADRIEEIVRSALPRRKEGEGPDWDWEDLAGPIAEYVEQIVIEAGNQDPDSPGKLRVDAGQLIDGRLVPHPDAVIVIDFPVTDETGFRARYNLADELIRYAAVGEQGWDVARQVDQLERTITRLRAEAKARGWRLAA